MDTLPIWVDSVSVDEIPTEMRGTKAIFGARGEAVLKHLPLDTLRESLSGVCKSAASMLTEVRKDMEHVGGFRLKQVAIQVEINAEGGVQLIGTAKVGGKGAITLTFGE